MGIFSRFEGKMEDTVEGAASKMSKAPIAPVQIFKKAEKQMRRETMVGAGKQYAPTLYTVLVNPDDDARLFGMYPTLAGETETYLEAKAAEEGLVMDGHPLVRFIVDNSLKHGKFDIIAETVAAPIVEQLRSEEMERYGIAPRGHHQAQQPQSRNVEPFPGEHGASGYGYSQVERDAADYGYDDHAQLAQDAAGYSYDERWQAAQGAAGYGYDDRAYGDGSDYGDRGFDETVYGGVYDDDAYDSGAYGNGAFDNQADTFDDRGDYAYGYEAYYQKQEQPQPEPPKKKPPLPYVPEEEIDRSIDYGEYTFRSEDFEDYRTKVEEDDLRAGYGDNSAAMGAARVSGAADAAARSYSADNTVAFAGGQSAGGANAVPNRHVVRARLIDSTYQRAYDLAGTHLTLGRESGNDIVVQDINASRKHAELRLNERGIWIITDLSSMNGTRVNGVSVASQPLYPGDVVTIGKTEFKFVLA